MPFSDEDLEPLYDLWFRQPVKLDFESPSDFGQTPLSVARIGAADADLSGVASRNTPTGLPRSQ